MTPEELKRAQELAKQQGSIVIRPEGSVTEGGLFIPKEKPKEESRHHIVKTGRSARKSTSLAAEGIRLSEQFEAQAGGITRDDLHDAVKLMPEQCYQRPQRMFTEEEIKKMHEEHDRKVAEASVPDWDTYRGDHHNTIPDPGISMGGGVDFRAHLDKPLSEKLWVDIVFRLRGFNLRVYHVGGCRWTDCWDNCTVWVDDEDIVRDIQYTPPCPYPLTMDTIVFERPGASIGHTGALARADFR